MCLRVNFGARNYASLTTAGHSAVIISFTATLRSYLWRCTLSFAHERTYHFDHSSVTQMAILAWWTSRQMSPESSHSSYVDGIGECWIGWWSLLREFYLNDYAHFCCNCHLGVLACYTQARQLYIANLKWNSSFYFSIFCLSKMSKVYICFSPHQRST